MVEGLDIKAFTGGVLRGWWQYALVAIIAAAGLVGILVIVLECWKSARNYRKVRHSNCHGVTRS